MMIIKLGGSLAASGTLLTCLNRVPSRYSGRIVIVPGGGVFAEQVRLAQQQWHFDETTAHRMAILAMQQMAYLFKGLKPDFGLVHRISDIPLSCQRVMIWSPDIVDLDQDCVAASWDITSDSLSAWLAKKLSANELILVKSTSIDTRLSLHELAEQKIVDNAFVAFTDYALYKITLICANSF